MDDPTPTADLERLRDELAGQYEIVRLIGRGGMGAVYLARELSLDRPVALKILPGGTGDASMRERFRREARIAARLSHPGIVPLYSYGETESTLYYVMAYVDGETLADRLSRSGPLSGDEVQSLLSSVASALDHAHRRGLIHRDIKPSNILLDDETGRILLTDFGIGRAVGAPLASSVSDRSAGNIGLTGTGQVLGTPKYMAPEQVSGSDVDGRADIYSLGVTAYEAAAGRPPFVADTAEALIARKLLGAFDPLGSSRPDLDRRITRVVDRCLALEPAGRPDTAERVLAMLENDDPETQAPGGAAVEWLDKAGLRTLVGYLAGGWVVLEVISQLVDRDVFPVLAYQWALYLYGLGLPVAVIAGWLATRGAFSRWPWGLRRWAGVWLSLAPMVLLIVLFPAIAALRSEATPSPWDQSLIASEEVAIGDLPGLIGSQTGLTIRIDPEVSDALTHVPVIADGAPVRLVLSDLAYAFGLRIDSTAASEVGLVLDDLRAGTYHVPGPLDLQSTMVSSSPALSFRGTAWVDHERRALIVDDADRAHDVVSALLTAVQRPDGPNCTWYADTLVAGALPAVSYHVSPCPTVGRGIEQMDILDILGSIVTTQWGQVGWAGDHAFLVADVPPGHDAIAALLNHWLGGGGPYRTALTEFPDGSELRLYEAPGQAPIDVLSFELLLSGRGRVSTLTPRSVGVVDPPSVHRKIEALLDELSRLPVAADSSGSPPPQE